MWKRIWDLQYLGVITTALEEYSSISGLQQRAADTGVRAEGGH